jgi:hypothetical protein
LWSCPNAGSSSAPLRGSIAAAAWLKTGSASTERPWHSYASHQFASCSENFAIRPEVSGQTLRDRTLYCLFYATRHPTGIEVFRDCQVKALEEQSRTRAATKVKHAVKSTGQREIFQSLHDMGPDDMTAFLESERVNAEKVLLALTPNEPASIPYQKLWPQVLARHVVRKPDVNKIAARLRDENSLIFLDWEKGKRVPQPHYKAQRPR